MTSGLHYRHARVLIAAGIVTFTVVGRDALKHPMTGHMQRTFFKLQQYGDPL
jgi:hypothetical protein